MKILSTQVPDTAKYGIEDLGGSTVKLCTEESIWSTAESILWSLDCQYYSAFFDDDKSVRAFESSQLIDEWLMFDRIMLDQQIDKLADLYLTDHGNITTP